MIHLDIALCSIEQANILNLDDILVDLESAIENGEDIAISFLNSCIELEVVQGSTNTILSIRSMQGSENLSEDNFFETLTSILSTLVEALNDKLLLDQDIALAIPAERPLLPLNISGVPLL